MPHYSQYCVVVLSEEDAKKILSYIADALIEKIRDHEKDENILQSEEGSVTLTINARLYWVCIITLHKVKEGFQIKLALLPKWEETAYIIEASHLGADVNGAEGLMLVCRFFLAILYHEINRFGLFQDILANPDTIKLVLDRSKSIKLQFEEFDELEAFNKDFEYHDRIRDAYCALSGYCLEYDSFAMKEILAYVETNQENSLENVD